MVMTIKEVAARANVSMTTVSSVLNDKTDKFRISEQTRRKVLQVVKETKYIPNHAAQVLSQSKTSTIGMVITNVSSPAVDLIIEGAQEGALKKDLPIILGVSSNNAQRELLCINNFLARRVDGIIVIPAPSGETIQDLEQFNQAHCPIVLCGFSTNTTLDLVASDVETGTYQSTKYLIELGHKRIALVSGNPNWNSAKVRCRGYQQAMQEEGLPLEDELVIGVKNSDLEAGMKAGKVVLEMRNKPDALVCYNDVMASGVMKVLLDTGMRIPDDMSLIGFDNDIPLAEILQVPLTTMASPLYEIGQTAVNILFDKMDNANNESRLSRSVYLKPKLVIRASCAPAKPSS